MLLAWFMLTRNWSLEQTLAYLQQQRPRVSPNHGFQKQVRQWVEERNAATITYPENPLLPPPASLTTSSGVCGESWTGDTRTFSNEAMHRIEKRAQHLAASYPDAPLAFVMLPGVSHWFYTHPALPPSRLSACVS